ncbi:Transcriptional activator protein CopR [Polaromonas vacuolata]|uniref:Transcriptional activator protein CopR n=1 Tax=Polaromonas vacuolata TaxID=37448 RepID=A0A6H2H8U8_9BURK|nr:response regulator [Polaromonas vacuolata]QJC56197.1 Transcriptional activator protein CopR [Polaromonas vacuolata]
MKRILIVDDAITMRMYHRLILQAGGFHVDEAINGEDALEKALRKPYDLYIVDINMPKLDGYGFLRQLRSEAIEQAPAFIVSIESSAHDQSRAFHAGANGYLVKPINSEHLLSHVRLLLGEAS